MTKQRRGMVAKLHLPWSQWPSADRHLWEYAVTGEDPFGDRAGARLSGATKNALWYGWRRFLGFLARHEPSALDAEMSERLTMERMRAFAAHLAETNTPLSVAIQLDRLYGAARIMMPRHDWAWLKRVKTRLYTAAPARCAGRPVITSLALLDLGQQLMDEGGPTPDRSMRLADAVRYRDGLMIALAAFVPLRRKNLASIEVGRHLVREGNAWSIIIPRAETKSGAPIEFAVPKLLVPYLEHYLDVVRPRMLHGSICSALWIGRERKALTYSAIWPIITRHTSRRLNVRVSPHDFRDAAATTWAIAKPDQIAVSSDLLGHANQHTTTKHYNRARGIEASRSQAGLIAKIRRGGARRSI
jgi:integrase